MNKLALLALALSAACGGDDVPKGTVNTASATTSVQQMVALNTAMSGSNGAGAASAIQSMTSSAQSLVSPNQMRTTLGNLPESFPKPTTSNVVAGTAECSAAGCTFTNYGDDAAGWSINGTVTHSGDTTTFDIDYKVTTGGSMFDWTIDGSVTLNATSLDGNVHSHGDSHLDAGSQGSFDITWDTKVDYNAIVLTEGCATGGSVHAEVHYDVSGQQGGGSYGAQGGATFGPACGTVTAD